MLNMVLDVILILVFFVVFKLYDIYVATAVIIAGAALQVIGTRLYLKRFDKKQLIVLTILLVFGGMTLYFHDPIFIKWKPTVVFWLLSTIFTVSHFFGRQPLTQRIMGRALEEKKHVIPVAVWKTLNIAWIVFFIILGTANVLVAYWFSTNAWVNFKVYGILSALLIFAFAQSMYLARYLVVDEKQQ